jgi:hypothetical protein
LLPHSMRATAVVAKSLFILPHRRVLGEGKSGGKHCDFPPPLVSAYAEFEGRA